MRLSSLEILGFKSFAKKGTLLLNAPITAIVGPNGSGKSNVAESFRFVLGEQSMKILRSKKGEDLIFNGAGAVTGMNKARVKVSFDNNDRSLDIDYDTVELERAVHRDGANEYFINGTKVRLKDVSELLAGANVGATGHHIISQGEADRILNANPRERRSMLEDALGLKVYQFRKQESEKKLEKTQENIVQVQSLRKEITPHLRFLQKQVDKIEKSKELRTQLEQLYLDYFKRESVYISYNSKRLEAAMIEPRTQVEKIEAALVHYRKELEENHQGETNESHEALEVHEKALSEVRGHKNTAMRTYGQLEGELNSLQRLYEREKKKLEEEKDIQVPFKSVKDLYAHVYNDVIRYKGDVGENLIDRIATSVQHSFEQFMNSFDDTSQDTSSVEDLVQEMHQIEEKRKKLEGEISTLSSQEQGREQLLDGLREELQKEKESVLEAERKILELVAEKSSVEKELHSLGMQYEGIKRDQALFDEEKREAIELVGERVQGYDLYQVVNASDEVVSDEELLSESRSDQSDRKRQVDRLKARVEEFGAGSHDDVLKEYEEVSTREKFLTQEIEDLEQSAEKLKGLIKDLDGQIRELFDKGIAKINEKFQEFFALMFNGGYAALKVVDAVKKKKGEEEDETDDPDAIVEAGLEVDVKLPRKKIKGLIMLSGGERALTSIALLFAMSAVNPPPFIILDETDAALDEANSKKYGDMVENLSQHSQLILITHNRETMARASTIYGVTMQNGVSQLLSIQLDDASQWAK